VAIVDPCILGWLMDFKLVSSRLLLFISGFRGCWAASRRSCRKGPKVSRLYKVMIRMLKELAMRMWRMWRREVMVV